MEGFKFGFLEGLAKKWVGMGDGEMEVQMMVKMGMVLRCLRKLTLTFGEKVNKINNGEFPLITPQ